MLDRFHLNKLRQVAVDKIPREEHARLKGTKYGRLKAADNMSEARPGQILAVFTRSLITARSRQVKEALAGFCGQSGATTARGFFLKWLRRVRARKGMQPMKRAAETPRRHHEGLLTWRNHRTSNALADGISRHMHVIHAAAPKFRNLSNFRTLNLFHQGKLHMDPAGTFASCSAHAKPRRTHQYWLHFPRRNGTWLCSCSPTQEYPLAPRNADGPPYGWHTCILHSPSDGSRSNSGFSRLSRERRPS